MHRGTAATSSSLAECLSVLDGWVEGGGWDGCIVDAAAATHASLPGQLMLQCDAAAQEAAAQDADAAMLCDVEGQEVSREGAELWGEAGAAIAAATGAAAAGTTATVGSRYG